MPVEFFYRIADSCAVDFPKLVRTIACLLISIYTTKVSITVQCIVSQFAPESAV